MIRTGALVQDTSFCGLEIQAEWYEDESRKHGKDFYSNSFIQQ